MSSDSDGEVDSKLRKLITIQQIVSILCIVLDFIILYLLHERLQKHQQKNTPNLKNSTSRHKNRIINISYGVIIVIICLQCGLCRNSWPMESRLCDFGMISVLVAVCIERTLVFMFSIQRAELMYETNPILQNHIKSRRTLYFLNYYAVYIHCIYAVFLSWFLIGKYANLGAGGYCATDEPSMSEWEFNPHGILVAIFFSMEIPLNFITVYLFLRPIFDIVKLLQPGTEKLKELVNTTCKVAISLLFLNILPAFQNVVSKSGDAGTIMISLTNMFISLCIYWSFAKEPETKKRKFSLKDATDMVLKIQKVKSRLHIIDGKVQVVIEDSMKENQRKSSMELEDLSSMDKNQISSTSIIPSESLSQPLSSM